MAITLFACGDGPAVHHIGAPLLASATHFAVLGASTVTNTGPSVIDGNLGLSPGTSVTGFPPGLVGGSTHLTDAYAAQAQSDLTNSYLEIEAMPCTHDLSGKDLGGMTLTHGVYCYTSSAQLTGPLVLDAEGNADAIFVFKVGSTLTTASDSKVSVINGGSICDVLWQVGTSATLGERTVFVGSILALTSVTLTTAVKLTGQALARNGAVTLDSNSISTGGCLDMRRKLNITGGTFACAQCGTSCVDLSSSSSDCGTCGTSCPADHQHCVGGSCATVCE